MTAARFACTLIAVALMRDHSGTDIDDDAAYGPSAPSSPAVRVEERAMR